jgi:hypothetical protein
VDAAGGSGLDVSADGSMVASLVVGGIERSVNRLEGSDPPLSVDFTATAGAATAGAELSDPAKEVPPGPPDLDSRVVDRLDEVNDAVLIRLVARPGGLVD